MLVQSRVVMLADFDYFFAQCEELRNPSIKDKPVVVGVYSGRTEDSGAVSTSNYIARRYGVKSGIPLFLAKRNLEGIDAMFFPVDHVYYSQISDRVMQILYTYASSHEQVSIDEAYLDVTLQVEGNFEKAQLYAQKIKQDVKMQVGLSLSIGIGPNKLIAKIACDSQKPDGLTLVRPEETVKFLAPLSVDRLLGVGKKTFTRMEQLGIKTIGDLSKFDVQRLVEVFGKALGLYFHNAANAIDNELVVEQGEAESISKIGTLKQDTRVLELLLQKTDELSEIVYSEVLERGYSFKTISICVVNVNLVSKSRSVTLEQPVKDKEVIKRNVRLLLEKYLIESSLEIRRVGVRVSGFSKEQTQQKQLSFFFG
ncbi:MAG: DNA polymerase IV [Candidatus Bathyarchaeota archaeon]|nr:DNA polymerase IV [Candidatus Termiticorpusculum sp.]